MEQNAPTQLNADEFASLRQLGLEPLMRDIPLQHQKRLLDLGYIKQMDGKNVVTEDGLMRLLIMKCFTVRNAYSQDSIRPASA
jgi:hypothetical protein